MGTLSFEIAVRQESSILTCFTPCYQTSNIMSCDEAFSDGLVQQQPLILIESASQIKVDGASAAEQAGVPQHIPTSATTLKFPTHPATVRDMLWT